MKFNTFSFFKFSGLAPVVVKNEGLCPRHICNAYQKAVVECFATEIRKREHNLRLQKILGATRTG